MLKFNLFMLHSSGSCLLCVSVELIRRLFPCFLPQKLSWLCIEIQKVGTLFTPR